MKADLRKREEKLKKKEAELGKKEEELRSEKERLIREKEEELAKKEEELRLREKKLRNKREEEARKQKDQEHKRFSDKKYLLPFGRYVGSTEVEPPADAVLVGREGQRAYLIDLLISTGRRGAYLVTGRRGVGKTSFVKHCISEYEASVFSRFLRGNVGRGVWDRILVLFFWLAILVGALLSTELISFFLGSIRDGASSARNNELLQWLILVPFAMILLYPCVYAKAVFEACFRMASQKEGADDNGRMAGVGAFIVVLILALGICYCLLLGSPTQGIALLMPGICSLYAAVNAVSFKLKPKETPTAGAAEPSATGVGMLGNWLPRLAVMAELVCVLIASFHISCAIYDAAKLAVGVSEYERTVCVFQSNFALSLIFLGLGSVLRGIAQWTRIRKSDNSNSIKDPLISAMKSGAYWYLIPGGISFISGAWYLLQQISWGLARSHPFSLGLLFLAILAPPMVFFSLRKWCEKKKRPLTFQPRPIWILSIKAIASIVVALQLAYPVLAFLLDSILGRHSASWVPFSGRGQEGVWLASLLVSISLFHFVEYEWIIRSYIRSREGEAFGAGGLAPWDEREPTQAEPEERRRAHRNLAELTLPWGIYKTWLPVLPVAVNLGFEKLDHRHVIQTMLVGLRERYQRTFLAWNSGFANLGRFLGLFILLILTALIGRLHTPPAESKLPPQNNFRVEIHGAIFALSTAGKEPSFTEKLWLTAREGYISLSVPGKPLEHLLLFNLLPYWSGEEASSDLSLLLGSEPQISRGGPFLDINQFLFGLAVTPAQAERTTFYLGVYHIFIFVTLFLLGHWLFHRVPLLPYKQNLRRIDDMLDSLSSHTKVTSNLHLWGPARWVYSLFSDDRMRESERDPVDPRTVELAFLQILEDVQKGGFRVPGAARHHFTLPAPEITFVFDELDKLGTRVDPEQETRDSAAPRREIQMIQNERERSLKLRSLLSDLKNILASAPARFIFVGGRDLHDEWLADQTSRQPLLTSIFNTEVYLPLLLTDQRTRAGTTKGKVRLHDRVEEYFLSQYKRALLLYSRSTRKRWVPSFGLQVEMLSPERFTLTKTDARPNVIDGGNGRPVKDENEKKFLLHDFVLFLTHRSMGNPKKLKDLLSSFIRPAGLEFGREVTDNERRWDSVPCRHVIRLGDKDVFRIQLVTTIYRHLAHAFEERMVKRDDKYATSIFFITDFLFKFHRRAFSWSNLERVDDLAHIHRLPDLRETQEGIVDHFSERFLHRVANGLYSFRFRSDIAREVDYVSRLSPTEMAAFNFTLDESLALKSEYLAAIEGSEQDNPDLVAALGELYEFDQDFERARHQYRVAIGLLDRDLARIKGPKKKVYTAVYDILNGQGDEYARIFLPWGIARLRLMLQIGMTFELEHDLELAEAEYRSARNLARSLVRAYVDAEGRGEQRPDLLDPWMSKPPHPEGRLHSLKHLNVLFQAMYAEAWLAEKSVGAIDTSVTLIERALWELRRTLPFVRNPTNVVPDSRPGTTGSNANFSLTLSQLHNKAGDLYFFKGRQPATPQRIRGLIDRPTEDREDRPMDGYLVRAHYHYAVSLHDLRRYVHHRIERSKYLLSISEDPSKTLISELLPDFLLRAGAGSINDMAEATLARVSLFALLEPQPQNLMPVMLPPPDRLTEFITWLGIDAAAGDDDDDDDETESAQLNNWFGCWKKGKKDEKDEKYGNDLLNLVSFSGPNPATNRLAMSLEFCLVGASLFEQGGYPEDAGRELLQVCETVTRYLWWARAVEWLIETLKMEAGTAFVLNARWTNVCEKYASWRQLLESTGLSAGTEGLRHQLAKLGIDVLLRVSDLFRLSRLSERSGENLIGEIVIPAEALTLACSLGLCARKWLESGQRSTLSKMIGKWTGEAAPSLEEAPNTVNSPSSTNAQDFVDLLKSSVQRHSYPMINRLNGMKVLIDNFILNASDSEESFKQALEWTQELLDLNENFNAPLHFTPFHSGTTCALVWLLGVRRYAKGNEDSLDRIHRAAQRDLSNSEEMYTMRRSYYEAISGLYYLYDDFNDRQIHFNQAIQMAGAELTALLKDLIDPRDEPDAASDEEKAVAQPPGEPAAPAPSQ